MLSFVCLPIFIILVYVPGSMLNAIPSTSPFMNDTINGKIFTRIRIQATTLSTHLARTETLLSETITQIPISSPVVVPRIPLVVDSTIQNDQSSAAAKTQKHPIFMPTRTTTLETTTFESLNEFLGNSGKNGSVPNAPTSGAPSSSSSSTSSSLPPASSSSSSVMSTSSTLSTTTSPVTTTTTRMASIFFNSSPTESATESTSLNVTSQTGTHAYLPCNVQQLVRKPVSWIRIRDGHILTVDETTFIADQRFQSIYLQNLDRWSLQIKYVQAKDAGSYECQVSTEPKTSSRVNLYIVEPKTDVIGEYNRHVKAGSRVTLRCIISEALEPPLFVNWFFNQKQIFLHNNKGWRTEVEREVPSNHSERHNTIASLIIPSVAKKDSGNYTCRPSNSESITVVLHVLNGEYSASAITSGTGTGTQKCHQSLTIRIILVMISLQISVII